jgi:simple sugar transport system ATP-binding protein
VFARRRKPLALLPGDALVPRQLANRSGVMYQCKCEVERMRVAHEQAAVLEAKGIAKRFGNTVALRSVDARLDAGRCLGLVGRNGAGKSTLVSILSGLVAPDQGAVTFDGRAAPRISDVASWKSRISTVYQRSMVVPWLTVAENVFLGAQPTRSGLLDWREMRNRTGLIMQEWGFDIDPNTKCKDLSVDQLQIVEIARALAAGTRCVLLDEPTAALERTGIATLFERVRQLVDRGVAVLYISHHLEEVFEICDDVTVLRDGQVVLSAGTPTLTKEDLVAAMVGDVGSPATGQTVAARRLTGTDRNPRLQIVAANRESAQGSLRDVSLEVAGGERVGVTGLLSAGVATLGRVAAGAERLDSGKLIVDGRELRTGHVAAALRAGVGYIPADRQVDGFVGQLGVAENQTMTIVNRLSGRFGLLRRRVRREAAAPMANAMALVASSLDQEVRELSGGNQQKVTVGRALIHRPGVIVAITPTRGVDVAAKALLLEALSNMAAESGAAMLLATDELDDLVFCDRVVVLVRGAVFKEFDEPPFDREQLIAATEGLASEADIFQ